MKCFNIRQDRDALVAGILGINKKVAVLVYQIGGGLSDIFLPTSGMVMATIAMGELPYQKWLKFV